MVEVLNTGNIIPNDSSVYKHLVISIDPHSTLLLMSAE